MKNKRWVWFNRDPSYEVKTVSVLALVETVLASAVVAYITIRYGTIALSISACIAPFLLLRTPESTELGLKIAERILFRLFSPISNWPDASYVILLLLVSLPLSVCATFARMVATVTVTCQSPVASICAIPGNWWRFVAVRDISTPVESLPGVHEVLADPSRHILSGLVVEHFVAAIVTSFPSTDAIPSYSRAENAAYRAGKEFTERVLILVLLFPYILLVFLPAFLYRFSLKGTSLIYSPLLYVVHFSVNRNVGQALKDIKQWALHRVMRWYAAFTIFAFAAKVYLFIAWDRLSTAWASLPGIETINAYVVPENIPPWQMVSVFNAALTWGVFFAADAILFRSGENPTLPPWIGTAFQSVWFIRGLLSIYTMACVLYITVSLVPTIHWPPLGPHWFPWSG